MSNQTTMNGRSVDPSPVKGVGRNMAGLTHDLLALGELQCQLIAVDLREAKSRSILPAILIVAALLLALGTMPVALLGVGWALVNLGGFSEGAAFLLVSLVSLGLVVGTTWWALSRLRAAFAVLSRSKQELKANLRWIMQALRKQGARAEVYRQRV